MQPYQHQFIEFCLAHQVLRFGQFTLKSGRISPYFFNAALFNDGQALAKLGQFYSEAIVNAELDYNLLFGPAYKGIPLVSATAVALSEKHNLNINYAFNRKEKKDHGEGGDIVGKSLSSSTSALIIDDVITAGTAIRESLSIIKREGAKPAGIVVALDREERGQGELSAIQELEKQENIPVISIIKMHHLLQFLQENHHNQEYLAALQHYRDQYGV